MTDLHPSKNILKRLRELQGSDGSSPARNLSDNNPCAAIFPTIDCAHILTKISDVKKITYPSLTPRTYTLNPESSWMPWGMAGLRRG